MLSDVKHMFQSELWTVLIVGLKTDRNQMFKGIEILLFQNWSIFSVLELSLG